MTPPPDFDPGVVLQYLCYGWLGLIVLVVILLVVDEFRLAREHGPDDYDNSPANISGAEWDHYTYTIHTTDGYDILVDANTPAQAISRHNAHTGGYGKATKVTAAKARPYAAPTFDRSGGVLYHGTRDLGKDD